MNDIKQEPRGQGACEMKRSKTKVVKRAKHTAVSLVEIVQVKCGWIVSLSCIKYSAAATTAHAYTHTHTPVIHQGFMSECSITDWVHFSPSYHYSKKKSENSSAAHRHATNTHYSHTTLITLGCLPMPWLYGTVWALNRSSISHQQSVTALFQPPCH